MVNMHGPRFTLVAARFFCILIFALFLSTFSGANDVGIDGKPNECTEWSTSRFGWRYCSDEGVRAKAAIANSDRCANPTSSDDIQTCGGALIAQAKLDDDWAIVKDSPLPPEIKPGEDGWCGSAWDSCCSDAVYDKYCSNRTALPHGRALSQWGGGFVVHSEDPQPEWAIFHMRKAEAYSSTTLMTGAAVYGRTTSKCEGSTKGRPYLKGASNADNLMGHELDADSVDYHVHIHDIHTDIYLAYAVDVVKTYPCGESKCGLSIGPNGVLRLFRQSGQHSCSRWIETGTMVGGASWTKVTSLITTTTSEPLCTDRDCKLRKTSCSNIGCKLEKGSDGKCKLVQPGCT